MGQSVEDINLKREKKQGKQSLINLTRYNIKNLGMLNVGNASIIKKKINAQIKQYSQKILGFNHPISKSSLDSKKKLHCMPY